MKDAAIVSLEQGNYDVASFLNSVQKSGWTGPIGLQSYSVQGNSEDLLGRSMKNGRKLHATGDINGVIHERSRNER